MLSSLWHFAELTVFSMFNGSNPYQSLNKTTSCDECVYAIYVCIIECMVISVKQEDIEQTNLDHSKSVFLFKSVLLKGA